MTDPTTTAEAVLERVLGYRWHFALGALADAGYVIVKRGDPEALRALLPEMAEAVDTTVDAFRAACQPLNEPRDEALDEAYDRAVEELEHLAFTLFRPVPQEGADRG